jgi:uncharacterized protein YegP (UPF0339 family)
MYETRKAAESGIASVKKNASDPKRFDRKKSTKGGHYFNLKAGNGEPIGKSETYTSSRGRENGIASVTKNAPGALVKVD